MSKAPGVSGRSDGDYSDLERQIPADTTRRLNVGLTLVDRLRRWTNDKPTLIQLRVSADRTFILAGSHNLANTILWPNAGLLLGQRRRRWANSKPTSGQRLMFAGKVL